MHLRRRSISRQPAVLDAELGMCWTGASIRREMLDLGQARPQRGGRLAAGAASHSIVRECGAPAGLARGAARGALPGPDRAVSSSVAVAGVSRSVHALFPAANPAFSWRARRSIGVPNANRRRSSCRGSQPGFSELLGHFNGERSIADMLEGRGAGGSEGPVGVRAASRYSLLPACSKRRADGHPLRRLGSPPSHSNGYA